MDHQSSGGTKTITLGLIFSWALGILFLLSGIGLIMSSVVTGLLVVLGGLIMLPPVNGFFEKQANVHLSGGVRFVIALVLFGVGVAFMSSDRVSSSSPVGSESPSAEQVQVKAMEIVDISTRALPNPTACGGSTRGISRLRTTPTATAPCLRRSSGSTRTGS